MKAKTPSTAKPKILNGNNSSQMIGYIISNPMAIGQQRIRSTIQSNNFIKNCIYFDGLYEKEGQNVLLEDRLPTTPSTPTSKTSTAKTSEATASTTNTSAKITTTTSKVTPCAASSIRIA